MFLLQIFYFNHLQGKYQNPPGKTDHHRNRLLPKLVIPILLNTNLGVKKETADSQTIEFKQKSLETPLSAMTTIIPLTRAHEIGITK